MTRFSPQPPRHLAPALRLGATRRTLLYLLVAMLFVSGAVWLYAHFWPILDANGLPLPIEPWSMKCHGLAAMAILFLSGTMLYGHMLHGWHHRRNRATGIVAASTALLLALSGYGLYYFDGEALRGANEWLHWIVGFSLPLLLWLHIAIGRRRAPKQPAA